MHQAAALCLLYTGPTASWLVHASLILATLLDWRRIPAIRCDWADMLLHGSASLSLRVASLRLRNACHAYVDIRPDPNHRRRHRLHLLARLLQQPCETVDRLASAQSAHLIPVVLLSGTSRDRQSVCFE